MKVTRVIFSSINNKWYLRFENLLEVETTEESAKRLINSFELVEISFNIWEQIN